MFDESPHTLLTALRGTGHRSGERTRRRNGHAAAGRSGRADPGEFVARDQQAVENDGAKIVVIDSLNGYLNAMPEERFLTIQLHELLMYLGQKSVATILIGAHQGLIGPR